MPDSQNKQGEPDIDRIAEHWAHRLESREQAPKCVWAFRDCLLEYKSLLSQQHAPVSEIHGQIKAMLKRSEQYKREAENDGVVSEAEKHARVSSVLQELDRLATAFSEREAQQHAPSKEAGEGLHEIAKKWYDKLEYGSGVDVWGMLLSALTELAAELTKGREDKPRCDHCGSHLMHLEPYPCPRCGAPQCCQQCCQVSTLENERDSLRQQLAEAESKMPLWVEKNNRLKAQVVALSAVVEKMKRGLESIVHECGINPTGEYYIIAHAATQLLADLGHK